MITLATSPSTFAPFVELSPDYRFLVHGGDGTWSYKEGLADPVRKYEMDLHADFVPYKVVEHYLIRDKQE